MVSCAVRSLGQSSLLIHLPLQDRAYRFGQTRDVDVYRLIGAGVSSHEIGDFTLTQFDSNL